MSSPNLIILIPSLLISATVWFFIIRAISRKKKRKDEASTAKNYYSQERYLYRSENGSHWWGVTNSTLFIDNKQIAISDIAKVSANFSKNQLIINPRNEKQDGVIHYLHFAPRDKAQVEEVYLTLVKKTGNDKDVEIAKRKIALAEGKEIRMRCNVCGHVFCYNGDDVSKNESLKKSAGYEALGAVAATIGVSTLEGSVMSGNADRTIARVKDFNRCPKCNSADLSEMTDEEFRKALNKQASKEGQVSAANELKQFKELLDMGVISQEEFDAKKKQLLGL